MTMRIRTKTAFAEYFKTEVLPMVAERYEQDGRPDACARREAWNDTVDAMIKDGQLPRAAGDWSIPDRLERCRVPCQHCGR